MVRTDVQRILKSPYFETLSNQQGLNQFVGAGLEVILNNSINPTNRKDAPSYFQVMDIGSALGYLFSKLPPPLNVSIETLRPRLVQYTALMSRISKMPRSSNIMTNVIFNPDTKAFHFGSTIQTTKPDPRNLKRRAQEHRYKCLVAAIGPLPVLPPNVEAPLVKLLKNEYLLPSIATNNTEDHTNYKNALGRWVDHPVGQKVIETREKLGWVHEDYLEWLYLQLSRSLLTSSNGTRPLVVERADTYTDANGWIADIVDLLMTNKLPVTYRKLKPIISGEVEGVPDGAVAGGSNPDPETVAVKCCLVKLLTAATVFEYIKKELAAGEAGIFYGHCAETYPMIHCANTRTANQGLALKIKNDLSLPNVTEAVTRKAFEYPCLNCRSLLHTMACPEANFDDYLLTKIKKLRGEPIPLNEYFVDTKREWNPVNNVP